MRGITVTLYTKERVDYDPLNNPIYDYPPVEVSNVLVAPASETEILETFNLTGRKAIYTLAIPKGDTHEWTSGSKVSFFGQEWRIIGYPTEGIESLIPLSWNKKVRVEAYDQG